MFFAIYSCVPRKKRNLTSLTAGKQSSANIRQFYNGRVIFVTHTHC